VQPPAAYDLVAVINHNGKLSTGHYTADVLADDNQWYHTDDSTVAPLEVRDGLHMHYTA
jgi:ubiquitin C-terminal hydrolase